MSWDEYSSVSHLVYDIVDKYAKEKPEEIALIDADDGKFISWKQLENMTKIFALRFHEMGFKKGDIVVSMLPMTPEHVYIEFACFLLGLIYCPLDVRLKQHETVRCVQLLKEAPRVLYIHPDDTDSEDKWGRNKFYAFKQFAQAIRKECKFVKNFLQFGPQEDADDGTEGILNFLKKSRANWRKYKADPQLFAEKMKMLDDIKAEIDPDKDGAMIIYTTGSTGFPKPAVLSNAGIVCQCLCLCKGFQVTAADRMLVNLPPSHVGCQTEQFLGTLFIGGIAVLLHGFRAYKSMQAIEDYRVTAFGQIPSLFVMEWRLSRAKGDLKDYSEYDLSSLRFALYGGQGVSRPFLEKLSKMAPFYASTLGMTEMSGAVSYTPISVDMKIDDVLTSLGHDYPVTPCSIRKPMNPDGSVGEELPNGEVGEICYTGPQIFLYYYGNEEATKKAISHLPNGERLYYTGDMGYLDDKGLHLSGRRKFIIKPKGFQVYPPEVEEHIQLLPEVALAAVIGAKHEVFSDGVVAYVEITKGKTITVKKLKEHCKELANYKRPLLYIFLDEIPLNRVDKTDYHVLRKMVEKYVQEERAKGGWDAP
jgi:fatty-acyl-CoA synthase